MFPLQTDIVFPLVGIAIAACVAVFSSRKALVRWKPAALVLGALAVAWPWPFAMGLGLGLDDAYVVRFARLVSAFTLIAVLVGFVWGRVARQLESPMVVMTVTLLPWFAGAAFLLEWQRVPTGPCSQSIQLQVGDLSLTIPRGVSMSSHKITGSPTQVWYGVYSDGDHAKMYVRALCRATQNGREPLVAVSARLGAQWFHRQLTERCQSSQSTRTDRRSCEAWSRTQLINVWFYSYPEVISSELQGNFNQDVVSRALSKGEVEGYVCNDGTRGPQQRHCSVWTRVTPEIVAVSTVWLGAAQEGEDPVTDSRVLIKEMAQELGAE